MDLSDPGLYRDLGGPKQREQRRELLRRLLEAGVEQAQTLRKIFDAWRPRCENWSPTPTAAAPAASTTWLFATPRQPRS